MVVFNDLFIKLLFLLISTAVHIAENLTLVFGGLFLCNEASC